MCLDWQRRHDEAEAWYVAAVNLDPVNYYLQALQGWHYLQSGEWYKAKAALRRSIAIKSWENPIARSCLQIVEQQIKREQTAPAK
jgi:hypothetical protein